MDTTTALIFSAHTLLAYCFVLWIQYSALKEFKLYMQNADKTFLDITAELNSLKKSISAVGSDQPKKILVEQKQLYSLK